MKAGCYVNASFLAEAHDMRSQDRISLVGWEDQVEDKEEEVFLSG